MFELDNQHVKVETRKHTNYPLHHSYSHKDLRYLRLIVASLKSTIHLRFSYSKYLNIAQQMNFIIFNGHLVLLFPISKFLINQFLVHTH